MDLLRLEDPIFLKQIFDALEVEDDNFSVSTRALVWSKLTKIVNLVDIVVDRYPDYQIIACVRHLRECSTVDTAFVALYCPKNGGKINQLQQEKLNQFINKLADRFSLRIRITCFPFVSLEFGEQILEACKLIYTDDSKCRPKLAPCLLKLDIGYMQMKCRDRMIGPFGKCSIFHQFAYAIKTGSLFHGVLQTKWALCLLCIHCLNTVVKVTVDWFSTRSSRNTSIHFNILYWLVLSYRTNRRFTAMGNSYPMMQVQHAGLIAYRTVIANNANYLVE